MLKLFAHRGFAEEKNLQNTIISLNKAKEKKFKAIEFDIWFCNNELLLKHDKPEENELKNLPKFHEFLVFKNDFFYWLDFKNLDEANCYKALQIVKREIDKAKIDFERLYFAPFITDYFMAEKIFAIIRNIFSLEVNLVAVCEKLENEKEISVLREFLTKNKIKYLSIFHELINEDFAKNFADIEIFAWTVNDHLRLKELQNLGVKNFATDKILPDKNPI